jgi:hypothetical protein
MGVALGQALGIDLGIDLGLDLCRASGGTPATIVASSARRAWFKSDTGITLNGSAVSGWTNIWGNGDLAQGTAANQPLYEAAQFGSIASVTLDTTVKTMLGTFSTPVAIGSRAYQWLYCQLTAVQDANRFLTIVHKTFTRFLSIGTFTTGAGVFRGNCALNGSTIALDGPLNNTTVHLLENGNTTGGTSQFVVSGTGYSGTDAGTVDVALDSFQLGLSSSATAKVAEWIVMEGEPSAQQKTDMRAYFAARYGAI